MITYCGFVAIIGRPNVGKSTLINKLLGQKISITSKKPHTTHYPILGVCTEGPYQVIYIDTPGLYFKEKKEINRLMNLSAIKFIKDVELILFITDGIYWTLDDDVILNKLISVDCPIILVINKIDNIFNKEQLLPHIKFLNKKINFYDIVFICAKTGDKVDNLIYIIYKSLPENKHYFPKEYVTNCSKSFIVSEIIREKLIRFLGDEIPYSVAVNIEKFFINTRGVYEIYSSILVESDSQKKIVIGCKGNKIKTIGIKSRQSIEGIFKSNIYLKLWVKVKPGWTNNKIILQKLGFFNQNTFF